MKLIYLKNALLLIIIPVLFSCSDLFMKDEVKTDDATYILNSFSFYTWQNSSILNMSSSGRIDDEAKTITLALPPSLDMDNQILTATVFATNEEDPDEYFWTDISQIWPEDSTISVTRDLLDKNWDGTSLNVTNYTLQYERRLIAQWNFDPDYQTDNWPEFFFHTDTPEIAIQLNDILNADSLKPENFIVSFSPITGESAYEIPLESISFTDASRYLLNFPNGLEEGYYQISINTGVTVTTESGDSFELILSPLEFAYDASAPTFVNGDSLEIVDYSMTESDYYFHITIPQAEDTLAGYNSTRYKIYYTLPGQDPFSPDESVIFTDQCLPVNGEMFFTYQSDLYLSDIPDYIKHYIDNGIDITFNIAVIDSAGRVLLGNVPLLIPDESTTIQ